MLTRLIITNCFGHDVVCEVVNLPVSDDTAPGRPRYLYVALVPEGEAGWDMQEPTSRNAAMCATGPSLIWAACRCNSSAGPSRLLRYENENILSETLN